MNFLSNNKNTIQKQKIKIKRKILYEKICL